MTAYNTFYYATRYLFEAEDLLVMKGEKGADEALGHLNYVLDILKDAPQEVTVDAVSLINGAIKAIEEGKYRSAALFVSEAISSLKDYLWGESSNLVMRAGLKEHPFVSSDWRVVFGDVMPKSVRYSPSMNVNLRVYSTMSVIPDSVEAVWGIIFHSVLPHVSESLAETAWKALSRRGMSVNYVQVPGRSGITIKCRGYECEKVSKLALRLTDELSKHFGDEFIEKITHDSIIRDCEKLTRGS